MTDERWAIGREHAGLDLPGRMARWSAGVLVAGWAFAGIDQTSAGGSGLFVSLDADLRDGLAAVARVPVWLPALGLAAALYLMWGSFMRAARIVYSGPDRAYAIDTGRGPYLLRATARLGVGWRTWLTAGWWLLAAVAGAAATLVTGALLRDVASAWLAWLCVLAVTWLFTQAEAVVTAGRYPPRPVVPTRDQINAAMAYWTLASALRIRPTVPRYGLALVQAYTGLDSAEISEYAADATAERGPVAWVRRWLVVAGCVIVYSALPVHSVDRFADDSWWGRLFVTAHGLAGVAQDNLGTALLLGAGALALVPFALAVVYTRLLLTYRAPRPVVAVVLREFRRDFLLTPLYLIPAVLIGAVQLALVLWLSAVTASATDSPLAGYSVLLVIPWLVTVLVRRWVRRLYTVGPLATDIIAHPFTPDVGVAGRPLPRLPRQFTPRPTTDMIAQHPDADLIKNRYGLVSSAVWIATLTDERIAAGSAFETALWNTAGPDPVWRVEHNLGRHRMTAGAAQPSGRWIARACDDGSIHIRHGQDGTPLARLRRRGQAQATTLAASPDGDWLACGTAAGTIELWDLRRRRRIAAFAAHLGALTALSVDSDGTRLYSAAITGPPSEWPLDTAAG